MSFYDSIKLIVNIILLLIILVVIIWFIKEIKYQKINKRLTKYAITKDSYRHSLFDIIKNGFINFRCSFSNILFKSSLLKKYAMKYDKYIDHKKDNITKPMDYIATKFILSFLFIIVLLVSEVIQNDSITFIKVFIAFTFGFFSLDVLLIGKDKMVSYQMKNDLLKAITIMNNSFKSGRSITGTIKIVADELDGPLQDEFRLMYSDLEYGLEIEEAFRRFNSRVQLDEVKYITTSLSILNKTGGNIIDVFDSIEKTVFNNRKLEEELKNISASSKALYRILSIIPFVFGLVIYILDPTYFSPLFRNTLGIIMAIMIVVIYVLYIILVKKIIRIKEY